VKPAPRHRIVQLLATGGIGGAQGSVTDLAAALDPSRFAVEAVFLTDGPAVGRMRERGIPTTVLDEPDDRIAVRALADHLREHEADLLHAHMYRAELLGARAARIAGTPAVIGTVHSSRVRSEVDVAALAALTPLIDHLVAPSAFIADKIRREGRGATPISIIPSGVDVERFAPSTVARVETRRSLGIPAEAFLVGVVARLEAEKGHRHLIAAWPAIAEALPDAWLLIGGTGSLADALRSQAAGLSAAERVIFSWPPDDVPAMTAALDLAVLPSLREAQGVALLEAMASGTPVVASAVGGIPETVRDGIDGLLVSPADPDALAASVIRLAHDRTLRARLADAGRRRVEETFRLDASVSRMETIYVDALAPAGLARPADG
jgi:glycosyltransferase involved in cell wall biosynthesis